MNSNQQHSIIKPLLWLVFGALCISFAPIFVKMLGNDVLGPTAIAFWRTLFGSLILFIWIFIRGDSVKLSRISWKYVILAGFLFYGDLFVWHRSIIFSGAGMATILGNTQVFWMALIGVVLFKEKISVIYLVSVIMAFAGVILLVGIGSDIEFTERYLYGIIFGLMTGIFYSSYMTSLKVVGHQKEKVNFLTVMAWASLFCAFFTGLSSLIEPDPMIPPDLYSWLVLLSLGLVAQAMGWWVISSNLPKLGASQSGIVLLIQPTLATVWGMLFFAEHLSTLQFIGAGLTLTAIYIGTLRSSNKSA